MKKLVIVDGSGLLYRTYHGCPQVVNSKGQHIGTIQGVMLAIKKLVALFNTKYFVVVFDFKGGNFRHVIYPEYKANRPPAPLDLISQIEPLYELIRASGIPLISIPGVEADDVIATLAKQASQPIVSSDMMVKGNFEVHVVTTDKDLYQLVDGMVYVNDGYKLLAKVGVDEVVKKFGVAPNKIRDFLALTGDVADNIPGVEGIGCMTAVSLLNKYGSLDNIIVNSGAIGGKIGANLRNSIDSIETAMSLIKLKNDVGINLSNVEMSLSNIDKGHLAAIYNELEIKHDKSDILSNGKLLKSNQRDTY